MSGDLENGLDLLKINLEAFSPSELDTVVVGCATWDGSEGKL
jgi:hypothetical protein